MPTDLGLGLARPAHGHLEVAHGHRAVDAVGHVVGADEHHGDVRGRRSARARSSCPRRGGGLGTDDGDVGTSTGRPLKAATSVGDGRAAIVWRAPRPGRGRRVAEHDEPDRSPVAEAVEPSSTGGASKRWPTMRRASAASTRAARSPRRPRRRGRRHTAAERQRSGRSSRVVRAWPPWGSVPDRPPWYHRNAWG